MTVTGWIVALLFATWVAAILVSMVSDWGYAVLDDLDHQVDTECRRAETAAIRELTEAVRGEKK